MPATLDDLGPHRPVLLGHCYRMLGSPTDAEDAVQETLMRAWRARDGFDGRASLRTWLTRIATNVCLDLLAQRRRREHPQYLCAPGTPYGALVRQPAEAWIEPVPDAAILPPDADPAEQAMLRQHVRLAFVAALQYLPPRQRATLLLADVLGWSAAEVAACLETSVAATNSALQRARATVATLAAPPTPATLDGRQRALLDRYVDAFERFDIDTLATLLRHDAIVSMPPITLWLQGRADFRAWMLGPAAECRGSRLLPVQACGTQGYGQYRPNGHGGYTAWALVVPELEGEHVARLNSFLDVARLFPLFGLQVSTPRVRLEYAGDERLLELADVAHDVIVPGTLPFDGDASFYDRGTAGRRRWLAGQWGARARTSPAWWVLVFAMVVEDHAVGTQEITGIEFPTRRSVDTFSWLTRSAQGQGLGKEMRAAVLELAFAGLGAALARSDAFADNAASMAVSRALGYREAGSHDAPRPGGHATMQRFELARGAWLGRRRDDIHIHGLEACLPLLGLLPAPAPV